MTTSKPYTLLWFSRTNSHLKLIVAILSLGVLLLLFVCSLIPSAVLTAIITQSFLHVYTLLRGYVSWREASYRLAATAVIVFLVGMLYVWVAGSIHHSFSSNLPLYHFAESKELLGSILAAAAM